MRFRTVCILGIVATGVGCSSDRAYVPPGTVLTDAQVSADVAGSAGVATATSLEEQSNFLGDAGISPSVNTTAQVVPAANGQTPAGPAPTAAKPVCTFTTKTGTWNCAPIVNAKGQTLIMSYAYFDGSGNATQSYNATTTEKIVYNSQLDGPVGDGSTMTGMTHRRQEQILTGLSGTEVTRTWNGAGTSADTTDYHTATVSRHYVGAEVDSMKNVVYSQPRVPGSYPLSGQTIRVANYMATAIGKATETRSVSRRIVTTFNGTANVTIKTGSVTCTLHLDTKTVDGCVPN